MAATDYSKRKNAELEELLKARGLPHTGKKAELVARLQASDAEGGDNQGGAATAVAPAVEDEIDWDDDAATAGATTAPAAAAMAAGGQVQPPNPVAVPNQVAAQDPAEASDLTVKAPAEDQTATSTSAPAVETAPPPDFASHIPSTSVSAELEKRKARAARFGLPTTTTEESSKALERAKRFGTDQVAEEGSDVANTAVAGLDSALPERERKRGRGVRGAEDGHDGGGKRRDSQRRDGRGATGGRGEGGRRNGAGTGAGVKKGGGGEASDKDRLAAEARKKRFAAAAAV